MEMVGDSLSRVNQREGGRREWKKGTVGLGVIQKGNGKIGSVE